MGQKIASKGEASELKQLAGALRREEAAALLAKAIVSGDADRARAWIAAGAEFVESVDPALKRPLNDAIEKENWGMALALAPARAGEPKALLRLSSKKESEGSLALAQELFKNGVRMDERESGDSSRGPLMRATVAGAQKLAMELLKRGANPSEQDEAGWAPLHRAAEKGMMEMLEELIKNGADLNAQGGGGGNAPLAMAIINERPEAAMRLIKAGANPGQANRRGKTPLTQAIGNNQEQVARELIKAGAPVSAVGGDVDDLLFAALEKRFNALAMDLIEAGASAASQSKERRWALELAAAQGQSEALEAMLLKGAEDRAFLASSAREAALTEAIKEGRENSVEALMRNGAGLSPRQEEWALKELADNKGESAQKGMRLFVSALKERQELSLIQGGQARGASPRV